MDISSVLTSVVADYSSSLSTSSANSASTAMPTSASTESTSSVDFSNMTIAQIRESTDQMAIEGKLTGAQQMFLIGAGLQDMDASDPSIQYVDSSDSSVQLPGAGYSISDTTTYNLNEMLNDYAKLYSSMSNNQEANVIESTEAAINTYGNNSSSVNSPNIINTAV